MISKRGLTVVMVSIMIVVITILASTIIISINATLNYSKLRVFATEIMYVQEIVDEHFEQATIMENIISDSVTLNLSEVTEEIKNEQFSGEKIINNTVLLNTIDLYELGIKNTVYGKGKNAKDFYALSLETKKVYYIEGYKANKTTYYTLTDELLNMDNMLQADNKKGNSVIFKPNVIGWSNQPIQVVVKIPSSFTQIFITATDKVVSTLSSEGDFYIATVNTTNQPENYEINVNYNQTIEIDGVPTIVNREAKYLVNSYDNNIPNESNITATAGNEIKGTIKISDNQSKINILESKYIISKDSQAYGVNDDVWKTNDAKPFLSSIHRISEKVSYGTYYIQVLSVDNAGNKKVDISGALTVNFTGNEPALAYGMTAIKWDVDGNIVETTANDPSWYNYAEKKWANAKTADGSMWVWIPRYEYKIPTPHSGTAQTILINFIEEDKVDATPNYIVHPAFTFGSDELTGMWMAKFEAGGTSETIKSKPGESTLREGIIGTMFTACRSMEKNSIYGWGTSGIGIDTHLTKNIEWGACLYLSNSIYGRNGEITKNNSSTYTGGGAGTTYITKGSQTTTGNIYGVYDMHGGAWEYTAAYVDNNNEILTGYGRSELILADAKYKDVYKMGLNDSKANNYTANLDKKGDAIYETSSSSSSDNSWYNDKSEMANGEYAFFLRGAYYSTIITSGSGAFAFSPDDGSSYGTYSYRPVLVVSDKLIN